MGYRRCMTDRENITDLEGRSDEELVEEYRRLKAELVYDEFKRAAEEERPGEAIEGELTRRGAMPDREDLIPEPYPPAEEHPMERAPDVR